MSKATRKTFGLCLLPVARETWTAGIPGSQGPRRGAVHFTLDFSESGMDLQPGSSGYILPVLLPGEQLSVFFSELFERIIAV